MRLKPLDEQVVVVFGASSGIGRETALRMARRGARVMASARDREGLESLTREIREEGGRVSTMTAEAADFEQVRAVAEAAVQTFGRLDTWVHVAAVTLYAPFSETTPDEFRRIVDVNLIGAAYGAMAALPYIRAEGRGALIFVSSVEGKYALPLQSAYSASKHGIEGFVKALRLELQREGLPISVTTVLPSTINTPLFDVARTKLGVKPKGVPPFYQPWVVADAILYAATHNEREIIVGGAGKALSTLNRISPRLADAVIARKSFWLQRTNEERSAEAPDNLYEPVLGHDRVEGSYSGRARPMSIYTWLRVHRPLRYALGGLALLGLAFAVIGPGVIFGTVRSAATPVLASLPIPRRRAKMSRMERLVCQAQLLWDRVMIWFAGARQRLMAPIRRLSRGEASRRTLATGIITMLPSALVGMWGARMWKRQGGTARPSVRRKR